MQESNKKESVWHLFSGVVIADLTILLIGLGGWDVLKNDTRILICVRGSILLLCGLFLIFYYRFAPGQLPAQVSQCGSMTGQPAQPKSCIGQGPESKAFLFILLCGRNGERRR